MEHSELTLTFDKHHKTKGGRKNLNTIHVTLARFVMTFSEIVAKLAKLASDLIYLTKLDNAHACPRRVKYPNTMIQILTVGGGKKHFICLNTTP